MVITLIDRRDYWVSQNGIDVELTSRKGIISVAPNQPITKAELEAVPEAIITAWLAEQKLTQLVSEIQRLAEDKVGYLIDPIEKAHWMGVHDAYSRQNALWLEEFTRAGIEQRAVNESTYPPLTTEEHMVWFSLSLIQGNTAPVRDAARGMIALLHAMTNVELLALPEDWVATHVLWP